MTLWIITIQIAGQAYFKIPIGIGVIHLAQALQYIHFQSANRSWSENGWGDSGIR